MTVRIIPEAGCPASFEELISRAVTELHPDFRRTVVLGENLPHEPSGKSRKVICTIPKS